MGGGLRDSVGQLALSGVFGEALALPATGYSFVYHLEIVVLLVTLLALSPLMTVARRAAPQPLETGKIGLAEFPT
ncbi:MAG: PucC family protein [Pseudomonadota bacterium]